MEEFIRTQVLLGRDAISKLSGSTVAVFGVGGVGGYVCEALARSGVGHFVLVDNDEVSVSNINRQIIATHKTIGMPKVQVMRDRIVDINPDADVECRQCFYLPENSNEFDFSDYSYVVDAVDTVSAKIEIIMQAKKCGVSVISSMGAGNKLDPTMFEVSDIHKTSVCPLARVMRTELRKRNIENVKVVYSKEKPVKPLEPITDCTGGKKNPPGSISFVPSVAGLIIAGEVIRDLIK